MYGSIGELMAADPSFAIPGVVPSRREPVLPTEDPDPVFRRLIRDVPNEPIRTRPGGASLFPLAQSDMQEKLQPALPPVRKAAEEMLEGYIAQLAPSMVRNITSPSDIPYITTPIQKKTNRLLMERLGGQLTPEEMGGFVYGNYPGFSGI